MLIALLLALQIADDGRDAATFKARIAAFDARARELTEAAGVEPRGQVTLDWLRALRGVLQAIPFARTDDPLFSNWLEAHDELVVYNEPGGTWMIASDLVWKLHDEHRRSSAADEIAWLAATNGVPGECEGYVPCYAARLDWLEGEYLRRHPDGRHRAEALNRIAESLTLTLDDMLKRYPDLLTVPDDCADLNSALGRLRPAVAARLDAAAKRALEPIDRLAERCPMSAPPRR
jgi:hypothetical protein